MAGELSRSINSEKSQSLAVLNRMSSKLSEGNDDGFNATKEINAMSQMKKKSDRDDAGGKKGKGKSKKGSKKAKGGKRK